MRIRDIKKNNKKSNTIKEELPKVHYAGFFSRLLGFVGDIFMIGLPIALITMMFVGHDAMDSANGLDVLVNDQEALKNAPSPIPAILQMIVTVGLWHKTMQTPGKKMAQTLVVDAKTFQRAGIIPLTIRFLSYFISFITGIGFFIGLLRKDKRALHDLISGTAVIYEAKAQD